MSIFRCLFKGLFFLFLLFIFSSSVFGEISKISFSADRIKWLKTPPFVTGEGRAILQYKDIELRAEYIRFNLDTLDIWAEKKVRLKIGDRVIEGKTLRYNLETESGEVTSVKGKEEFIFYNAEKIYLTSEKIKLLEANITTCNFSPPHYRIRAKEVNIDQEKKVVVIRNCFLYFGKHPVFWVPSIVRHFGKGREIENKMMFPRVGYSSFSGWYIKTGYYFYILPALQSILHLDYRRKKGWAEGIDLSYRKEKKNGKLESYFIKEKDTKEKRWRLKLRYDHLFSKSSSLKLNLDWMSDENFLKNYFPEEDDEISPSFLSLSYKKPDSSFNFLFAPEVNLFKYEESIQLLPQIKFNFCPQKIGKTNFYIGKGLEAVNFKKAGGELIRFDSFFDLSYPFTLFRYINIEPKVGYHIFLYKDREGKEGYRKIPYQELNSSLKIDWKEKDWVYSVKPTLGYCRSMEEKNDFILPFDLEKYEKQTEDIHPSDAIKAGIESSLFYKEDNILKASLNTKYNLSGENKGFSSLEGKFFLNPFISFYIDFHFLYDYPDKEYKLIEGEVSLKNENWHLDAKIEKDIEEKVHEIELRGGFSLDERWKFSFSRDYDVMKDELSEERYSVWRSLHCWAFELSYQIKPEKEYEVGFYIKAFLE